MLVLWWFYDDLWWLYGDFMVILWWLMVILWWFMVILWWFYGDLKEFNWWCNGISNHRLFLWVYVNWRDWAKYRVNLISAMNDGYGCVRGLGLATHRQNRSQNPGGWCWVEKTDPMHVVSQETKKTPQSCSNPGLPPWLSETEAGQCASVLLGVEHPLWCGSTPWSPKKQQIKNTWNRDEKAAPKSRFKARLNKMKGVILLVLLSQPCFLQCRKKRWISIIGFSINWPWPFLPVPKAGRLGFGYGKSNLK